MTFNNLCQYNWILTGLWILMHEQTCYAGISQQKLSSNLSAPASVGSAKHESEHANRADMYPALEQHNSNASAAISETETHTEAITTDGKHSATEPAVTDNAVNMPENDRQPQPAEPLLKMLSQILNVMYVPCANRWTSIFFSRKFQCSCDVNTCGIARNCCPDVRPRRIEESTKTGINCRHLFNAFYTNFTYELMTSVHRPDVGHRVSQSMSNEDSELNGQKTHSSIHLKMRLPENTDDQSLVKGHTNHGHVSGREETNGDRPCASNFALNNTQKHQMNQENIPTENNTHDTIAHIKSSLSEIQKAFPRYLTIETCNEAYSDRDVVERCTETDSFSMDSYIPVSSYAGQTYKNVHCALCNNVEMSQRWLILTDCLHLYMVNYVPNDVRDFLSLTRNCTVVFRPPKWSEENLAICQEDDHLGDITEISKCNMTGSWGTYDAAVEKECLQQKYMPLHKVLTNGRMSVFKNVFCYICNRNKDHINDEIMARKEGDVFKNTSLQMEVTYETDNPTFSSNNVSQAPSHSEEYCPDGFMQGYYQEGCVEFRCPFNKIAFSSLCLPKSRQVTGLVVGAYLRLFNMNDPLDDRIFTSVGSVKALATNINNELGRLLSLKTKGCTPAFFQVLTKQRVYSKTEVFLYYKLEVRDECSIEDVFSIFTLLATEKLVLQVGLLSTQVMAQKYTFSVDIADKYSVRNARIFETFISKAVGYEITLDPLFHCPKVILPQPLYKELVLQGHITQGLRVRASGVKAVEICYYDYVKQWLFDTYERNPSREDVQSPSAYLTLVSTIISITSTVAVLITYSLFSELRFVPGKLFMIMCLNLLLAQLFFEFGINSVQTVYLCRLMGACIHVFWLATLFSMNACLRLMLRNVQQPLNCDNRVVTQSRSSSLLCRHVVVCYVIPVGCSVLNVYIARVWYKDPFYGYGEQMCFISKMRLKLATFVVPIVVVLIFNFIIFALIIKNISQTMNSRYKLNTYKHITVFFKLSTLAGIFWFFGLLYEVTDYPVFEYLFIVLNGGHGFFIMLSFLFNHRVLGLYKGLFRGYSCRLANDWSRSVTTWPSKLYEKHKPETIRNVDWIASSEV